MAETISGNIGLPYTDLLNIREFDITHDESEYVWHRDLEDREIEVLEGDGWQFQMERCLPWLLETGMVFDIRRNEYHRLIKGTTNLKLRIIKRYG